MGLAGIVDAARRRLAGAVSGAIVLREAARTSRRWQTYASRTAFSGILLGLLLLGMYGAIGATRSGVVDAANLGWLGRGLFVAFSVLQTCLALILAPMTAASAIVEETDERTMEMLVLTRLRPGQILGAKILSRVLLLVTVVCGALPILALVVNLGGVSTVEVVAVTVHTLTTVALLSTLGAFFALFTRSPALATMASASYAVPFFLLLPMAYVLCTGDPYDAAHLSTFAAASARDWLALLPPLTWLPSMVVILGVATPLFQYKVSNADFRHAFADDVWRPMQWAWGLGAVGLAGVVLGPFLIGVSWWLGHAKSVPFAQPVADLLYFGSVGGIWVLFSLGAAVGTWGFLRVGMDVVDGIDGVFSRPPSSIAAERRSTDVGANPVWWREARFRAWMPTAAPIFVTWGMVLLAVFQTGWWVFPGGLLALGVLNSGAALMLGAWLASRSVTEERRRGTLEVLVATTMSSARILAGKLAGAVFPTLPLMALSLPLLALGVPHLHMVTMFGGSGSGNPFGWAARGVATWFWLVPVWTATLQVALVVALRARRPRSAFGLVMVAVAAALGLPAVVGRALPDSWLALPARIVAPPLAGDFAWWQLLLSFGLWVGLTAAVAGYAARNLRGWVGGLAALLAVWALAPDAAAAVPGPDEIAKLETVMRLRMTATPMADGLVREGRWTTLRVRIENLGPATVGEVGLSERVGEGTTAAVRFRREVELAEGARKDLLLLVRSGAVGGERVLELTTREGRTALAVVRTQAVGRDDVLVGVIGRDPLGLPAAVTSTWADAVPGAGPRPTADGPRQVRTGLVAPEATPRQSAGWESLDWVAWPAADPSRMSAEQARALRGWVADGGHLLLMFTDTWRQVAGSELEPALPVELSAPHDTGLGPLLWSFGAEDPGGVAPVVGLTPRRDRPVWVRGTANDGSAVWVSGRYGLGTVHVLVADPGAAPLSAAAREPMWRELLTLPPPGATPPPEETRGLLAALHMSDAPVAAVDPWQTDTPESRREGLIRERLADIPGVAPVPLEWLAAFSLIYLFAIGPLDWLVLRAIGKQPWTWVTFPILITVFSAVSLAGTSYTKGSQAVFTRVELLDFLPDGADTRGQSWFGVFSTRKTSLSVTGGTEDAVVAPLAEPGFVGGPAVDAGGGAGRFSWAAETWTLAYGSSRWVTPVEGAVQIDPADGGWRLTSRLPFDLEQAAVWYGREGRRVDLGPLPAGASVRLPRDSGSVPATGTDVAWAIDVFGTPVTDGRGSLEAGEAPILFGTTRRASEALILDGLAPVEQPLTVVRVPLELPWSAN